MEPNCPHLAPAASLAAVWSWGSIFWPGQGVWAAPWGAAQAPWEGHLDSQFHLFVCDQPHPGAPRYSTVSGCQASWTRRAVSGRRGHDPRGRDKEQENSGRKAVQSGPHTPQRPDASSGVPEHPGPKPGSEPKVYHQGESERAVPAVTASPTPAWARLGAGRPPRAGPGTWARGVPGQILPLRPTQTERCV